MNIINTLCLNANRIYEYNISLYIRLFNDTTCEIRNYSLWDRYALVSHDMVWY